MWNTDLINSITLSSAAVVPIIVAITQMFKMMPWMRSEYAPFIAIAVGILVAYLLGHDTNDMSVTIFAGILYGLASSGLYSGIQTSAHAIKAKKHKNDNVKR